MVQLFPKQKKTKLPALISPADLAVRYARGISLPEKAVLCPFGPLVKQLITPAWKKYNCFAEIYVSPDRKYSWIVPTGVGAASAALAAEIGVALGVKQLIFIGTAAGLQEELEINDWMVCAGSLCDDGVSPSYVSATVVTPHTTLTRALRRQITAAKQPYHYGLNWTTEALLRETKAEVRHYQRQQILSVEMETSAVLAVCKKRRVCAAVAYVISDTLHTGKWQFSSSFAPTMKSLRALGNCAVRALTLP